MQRLLACLGVVTVVPVLLAGQADASRPAKPTRLTAPRIAPRADSTWTDADRALVAAYSKDGGTSNYFKTFMNSPDFVQGVMPLLNYIENDSSLDPKDRELLIMRTAWDTQSEYVWGHHNSTANKLGLHNDEIKRIAQGPLTKGWRPFDATLLRLADEIYKNSSVSNATWAALTKEYNDKQAIDAVFTCAEFVMLGGMFNSLGVQLEPQLAKLPGDVPYNVTAPPREPSPTTARINAIEAKDWTPEQKAMLDPSGRGNAIALYRTIAHNPKLYPPRNVQSEHIRQHSTLSAHTREALILRAAWNARAEYIWAQHVKAGRDGGNDVVRIATGPDAVGWDPLDLAGEKAVDELVRNDMISDATWQALSAKYDAKQMLDVMITGGGYREIAMAANAMGVQLEPNAERFPTVTH